MPRAPWEITREMFLSEEEVDRLRRHLREAVRTAAADQKHSARLDRFVIEALLFSGLRNSEFCRLTLADTAIATGQPVFVVRGPGKRKRTVYLPSAVNQLVERYVARTRPLLLPSGADQDDPRGPLVVNERGKPYERTGLYRRVVRILSDAGLGDRASVQLLRHTYGYLAYKRTGCNLLFVQRQLGHAHPMVTSVYAQFVHESCADVANCIAAMSKGTTRRRARSRP